MRDSIFELVEFDSKLILFEKHLILEKNHCFDLKKFVKLV